MRDSTFAVHIVEMPDVTTDASVVFQVITLDPLVATFSQSHGEMSANVSGPLRSNNALALREACLRGVGIALLPGFLLGRDFGG